MTIPTEESGGKKEKRRSRHADSTDRIINERLKNAFKAVIDQQIDEKDPVETLETLERLQDEGFTEEEAYTLISHLIGLEVAEEVVGGTGIDMNRYIASLEALPRPFAKPRKVDEEE